MAAGSAARTPFDAGANSVKVRVDEPNPFTAGSIEFRNFELGRSFALRRMRVAAPTELKRPA